MKITTKGQVTIPKQFCEKYGLFPDTDAVSEAADNGVVIRPARDIEEQLKIRLAHATGSATVPITTDDILALTRGDK